MRLLPPIFLLLALLIPPMGQAEPGGGETRRERYAPILKALTPYKIILVPGFGADFVEKKYAYFKDQKDFLRSIGLIEGEDFYMMDHNYGFDGEQSLENNFKAIAAAILLSPRPVILISHCKGSVETLMALLTYKILQKNVKAWFSIQGAFGGSAVADVVRFAGVEGKLIDGVLWLYKGSSQALDDLMRAPRRQYLKDNAADIIDLTSRVKVITYASSKRFREMNHVLQVVDFLYYGHLTEGHFDGLVAIEDALLPGAKQILGKDADHTDPVYIGSNFDRVGFLQQILVEALR